MKRFSYYIFLGFLFFLKITPFFLLYLVSDLMYFFMYYILKYRRKVVYSNLKNSFPEKSEEGIIEIIKAFYRNLSDILVESVKGYSMSPESFRKRYKIENFEFVAQYLKSGRTVIALASHYGNWEWGVEAVAPVFQEKVVALYKPLSNKYIDKYLDEKRKKGGMHLVPITETREIFEESVNNPTLFIMAADQNPGKVSKAIWVPFLNRETACLHGPESYAKRYNTPLVYFDVQRVKRGYYTLYIKDLYENPAQTEMGFVTGLYMQTLEKIIKDKPGNWLWSHKRWKHKKKKENE